MHQSATPFRGFVLARVHVQGSTYRMSRTRDLKSPKTPPPLLTHEPRPHASRDFHHSLGLKKRGSRRVRAIASKEMTEASRAEQSRAELQSQIQIQVPRPRASGDASKHLVESFAGKSFAGKSIKTRRLIGLAQMNAHAGPGRRWIFVSIACISQKPRPYPWTMAAMPPRHQPMASRLRCLWIDSGAQ